MSATNGMSIKKVCLARIWNTVVNEGKKVKHEETGAIVEPKDCWVRISSNYELGIAVYFTEYILRGYLDYALIVITRHKVVWVSSHKYGEYLCELYEMIDRALEMVEGVDTSIVDEFKRYTCAYLSVFLTIGLCADAHSWFDQSMIKLAPSLDEFNNLLDFFKQEQFDIFQIDKRFSYWSRIDFYTCLNYHLAMSGSEDSKYAGGMFRELEHSYFQYHNGKLVFITKVYAGDINEIETIGEIIDDYIRLLKPLNMAKKTIPFPMHDVKCEKAKRTSSLRRILMFINLNDYNTCKIEFEKLAKDGELGQYKVEYLKLSSNGLPLMSLIEPCERAKEKGYGRGVLYGRRAVKAKWEKILIITL